MLHLYVLQAAFGYGRGRDPSRLKTSCLLVSVCLLDLRLRLVLALDSLRRRLLKLQVGLWLRLKVGHLDPHLLCMALGYLVLVEGFILAV